MLAEPTNENSNTSVTRQTSYEYVTLAPPLTSHQADPAEPVAAELERIWHAFTTYRQWTEAALSCLGEGLIAVDRRGRITLANPYAVQALGLSEDELLGQWFPEIMVATDQMSRPLEPLARPVMRSLTTGESVSERIYYQRRDGSLLPVAVTVSPLIIGGVPEGAIEVFRDLSGEEQLDIAKDEFVSLASHQLRTPVAGVRSILSMLANGDFGSLTERQQHFLNRAVEANNHQLQIIEDLLNVAKIDAGHLTLEPSKVDLASLVREVAADYHEMFSEHRHAVELLLPDHCSVTADEPKLRMVIDNLLGNASKYTPADGTIWVRLTCSATMITLEVEDTGSGIAAEQLPYIFKKFGRLANHNAPAKTGNGIGLFLVKSIIELHGGSVDVISVVGAGSKFTLSLPSDGAAHA